MKATIKDAIKLFSEGSQALAQVEANGIKVDTNYLEAATKDVGNLIKELEARMREDDVYELWRKRHGKPNLGSPSQMADVFFKGLGYPNRGYTERTAEFQDEADRTLRADKDAFSHIDHPFIHWWRESRQLKTVKNTFLKGIRQEVVDGFIHPVINLHLVITQRSSSDSPNSQNWPKRDEGQAKWVRRCFIARDGHVLVEHDFKTLEVNIGCCYHHDPVMIDYVRNSPPKDMHRDMAMQIYCINDAKLVSKPVRYCAKAGFVFPSFYGSYWRQCATNLWEFIFKQNLTTTDGMLIKDILEIHGITELGSVAKDTEPEPGTFAYHLREVEQDFWNRRFRVYKEWKESWWQEYCRKGYYETLTGFIMKGVFRRNQVLNGAIQGDAFHCDLWVLIEMQKWLNKYRMKSRIVGEIHDSMIGDVHEKELQDYLAKVEELTTVDLPRAWKWISVPLGIEASVAPPGGTWLDMKEWLPKNGKWVST